MKMVKRSQSVPCTEIFLALSGIRVDQLQTAIIHFMFETGLGLKEAFRLTFPKRLKFTGEFLFFKFWEYTLGAEITFRRKREKRNTNTSGEYILISKVVQLVTRIQ